MRLIKALCVCLVFLSMVADRADAAGPLEPLVDELMAATLDEWRAPGAVIAVVEDYELRLVKGYGVANVATGEPVDPYDTVFHVASVGKPVTAMALLQLYERGEIDLHADVNDVLRHFQVEPPAGEPLTAHHLLTHSGGLDIRRIGRVARSSEDLAPLGDYLAARLPAAIRPPGALSVYSNHGYALIGFLVEEVSGQPFADYMEQQVFVPLGMRSSSYALRPELEARLATGYGWAGLEGPPEPLVYQRTVPSSLLRTTAADMGRWMQALLDNGKLDGHQVLRPETARLMLSRQFANHPLIRGRSYGLSQGFRFDPPVYLHSGGTAGFSSALVLQPETGFGVFLSFNSRAFAWDLIGGLLDRLEGRLAPYEAPAGRAVEVDSRRFAGWYRSANVPLTSVERLGSLFEQARVTVAGPGAISWDGRHYRAIDPLAFAAEDGRNVVAFGEEERDIRYFFGRGGEYERVSWLRSLPVQGVAWVLFLVTFVVTIILALRRRGRPYSGCLGAAALASTAYLVFFATTGYLMSQELGGEGSLEFGAGPLLWFSLSLPLVGAAFALVSAYGLPKIWRQAAGRTRERVALTLLVLAQVAFVPFLASWNLLGFHF